MHLITHRNHITPEPIPDQLTDFIIRRFDQLAHETAVPPIIMLLKPGDGYAFMG